MKVINLFPNGPKAVAVPPKEEEPVRFTCPHCECKSELSTNPNMVFRTIEFLCGGCSTVFRLVNPNFVAKPKPKHLK